MRLRKGREDPEDPNVAYLADIARASGDDIAHALGLALLGLDPSARVALLSKVIDGLPPAMRAAIWGDAVFAVGDWQQLRASIAAEERRPKLVEALAEQGRRTGAVDLAAVPTGTEVGIGLFSRHRNRVLSPDEIRQSIASSAMGVRGTMVGDGRLELRDELYVPIPPGDGPLPANSAVTLGGYDADGNFTSVIRYGKPVVALTNGEPNELKIWPSGATAYSPVYVGELLLDSHVVFP